MSSAKRFFFFLRLIYSSFTEVSNKKKLLVICLTILVLAEFIAIVVYYSELQPISAFTDSKHADVVSHTLSVAAALNACVDTALALSVVALLHRRRAEVPFKRTISIIDHIMIYSVGSGLLTAAFALASFVTSLTMPKNFIYVMLWQLAPKRESIFQSIRTR